VCGEGSTSAPGGRLFRGFGLGSELWSRFGEVGDKLGSGVFDGSSKLVIEWLVVVRVGPWLRAGSIIVGLSFGMGTMGVILSWRFDVCWR